MSSEIDRKVRIRAMLWIMSNLMLPFILIILTSTLPKSLNVTSIAFLFVGLPLVYPLVIWLINRRRHDFINQCTREHLNFTLSTSLYLTILTSIWIGSCFETFRSPASPLQIVLAVTSFAIPIVCLIYICLTIFASIQAARGNIYKYPLTIRFLR